MGLTKHFILIRPEIVTPRMGLMPFAIPTPPDMNGTANGVSALLGLPDITPRMGLIALYSNTTGNGNTASGVLKHFMENATGYYNTANGSGALISKHHRISEHHPRMGLVPALITQPEITIQQLDTTPFRPIVPDHLIQSTEVLCRCGRR